MWGRALRRWTIAVVSGLALAATSALAATPRLGVYRCGAERQVVSRCDEFCDATRGFICEEYYQPAGCVSQCEQDHYADDSCRAELDIVIACFRKTPAAVSKLCDYSSFQMRPCSAEQEALTSCASQFLFPTIQRE